MNERQDNDEKLLIDFILGRCDPPEAQNIRRRMETDEPFGRMHNDLANAFAAMSLAPETDPPENLVDRTLERIRTQHATDALLAGQKPAARIFAPTFSLRELSVAAAAIIVLALIFVPSIIESKRRAAEVQCASHVGQIGAAIQAHASGSDDYLPGVMSDKRRWLPAGDQPAVSNSAGLFKLISARHVSPLSFQCPAVGGASFVVHAGMTDFPRAKFISYSYQYTLGPGKLRINDHRLRGAAEHMAILADGTPIFQNGRFRSDRINASAGDNHGGTGQNVLYLDMHVEWKSEASAGINKDNIFLAGNIRNYQGTETPICLEDTFLLPTFSQTSMP